MSKDPYSGIGRDYLLEHLPKDVLTREVGKALKGKDRPELRGKNGHCPFSDHKDKHRSFSVTDGEGWTCHGCDRHGTDVIDFRIQLDGLTVDKTIAALAQEYGITRPDPPKGPKAALEAPKSPRNAQELLAYLLTLPDHSGLSERLHAALLAPEGEEARVYLEGRGISEAAWIRHGLGYVVPGSCPGAPLSPAWEGMITFPIRAGEHVINFAGRRIREEANKPDKLNCSAKDCERWPFNMNALLLRDEVDPQVFIAEGPISALALEEMYHGPAVALLGSTIERDWWPLFTREPSVILCLDPKKGETPEELEERNRNMARTFRRTGFWRYMLLPEGMDPADLWRARGFSSAAPIPELVAPIVMPAWRHHPPAGNAFEVVLPDGPDKHTAEILAWTPAKGTQGLTLTLRYEEGPGLGHYLEFTRRDGRPFSYRPLLETSEGFANAGSDQAAVLALYAQGAPIQLSEDVYQEGGLEINLELMRAIKGVRRGLHLAVADGRDPELLTTKTKPRPLPDTAKMPTRIVQQPATRPKRSIEHRLERQGPQGKAYEVIAVDRQENPLEQLELPGLETLTAFDMNVGRAVYALYNQSPGPIIRTSCREVAKIMGANPDSGTLTKDTIDALARLSGWAWRFDEVDEAGNRRGRLLRLVADYAYEGDKVSIGIPPLTHELLTEGRQGRDWMFVSLEKYRGLSPAAATIWGLISAWRAPREWDEDNLASLVSDKARSRERRETLHKALDELLERGQLYRWERVQGSTTGAYIIRLVKTATEARARLRRKNESVIVARQN